MIDLSGVARHLRLSVEQLRVVADLLEQGYQPGFIERYRADETGNLPRSTLWLLKLEIDRQLRLQAAREKAARQLPKDAELDAEASKYLERATTEVEIEAALRAFRSRRALSQNQESDKQASQLLEKLIEYQGPPIDDLNAWSAEQLSIDAPSAEIALQHASRLVSMLMHSDSNLNEKLRRTIQKLATVRVQLCELTAADSVDSAEAAGDSEKDHATHDATDSSSEEPQASEPMVAASTAGEQAPSTGTPTAGTPSAGTPSAGTEVTAGEVAGASASTPVEPSVEKSEVCAAAEQVSDNSTTENADTGNSDTGNSDTGNSDTGNSNTVDAEPATAASPVSAESPPAAAELVFSEAPRKTEKKLGRSAAKNKDGKQKESRPSKKPVAKMTPRQRRRRWLIAMLQPMKSLKCPLSKLSSYQQLMLGRGRRSQLVKTNLEYDKRVLVALARDTFVTDRHPLAAWFSAAAEDALEHSLRAKCELDAVTDLEEIAAERLLENSVDQLRQSLLQRPVRGHCILVIDAVGPKAAAVAVVGPSGQVLAIDEIPCSASPGIVNQNVMRLGELVHQYRVTLIALTNGPARRFLVLSLRELMKQSASSGLRWTMADRGGADAYAVSRSALKELSVHNRRHRAAIWVGRSLQDPLSELLKVDVNRLRLGSFQRELPQEPLKKLVRETIADCLCLNGLDARKSSADQLACVSGVSAPQAQQISAMASQGTLNSRKALLENVSGWSEMDARQAIGLLRVYGGEQPLDATTIHPDDYRLAERLIENTELQAPPAAPEGWTPVDIHSEPPTESSASPSDSAVASADANAPDAETAEPAAQQPAPATEVVAPGLEGDQTAAANEVAVDKTTVDHEPQVDVVDEPVGAVEPAAVDSADDATAGSVPVEASLADQAEIPTDTAAESPLESWPEKAVAAGPRWPDPEYPESIVEAPATPPTVDVEKLARGWQVGREKLRQVASCLHAPFADPRLSHPPVPLMSEMPTLSNLQPGMCVWAVVIGVADFGAFVELAPDCSGLIHISRLSPNYIEDPHQCVQVGDLVMAWVVSVDEKKNRVALTALSPAQRAAADALVAQRKAEHEEHRRRDRGGSSAHRPAGTAGQASAGSGAARGGGQSRSGEGRGGDGRRGGGQAAGGRSRGGGHAGGRDRGRGPQSKTVVVTSKKPKANITEAMKEGEEPLRSFSDLMQFYQSKRSDDTPTKKEADAS